VIYIRVGVEIFQKRSQLRAAGGADGSASGTFNSISAKPEPAFTGLRTTEIEVTHDPWSKSDIASPTAAYNRGEDKMKENYSITISAPMASGMPQTPRTPGLFPKRPNSMDKVKWAYTKVALLFAVSILITWVPASVNRVYGLRYPSNPSFVLNIGSALVLPLQGFWNTVIYFTTSLTICKGVIARFKSRKGDGDGFRRLELARGRRRGAGMGKESESMVELSTSRSLTSRGESF